jgi:cobalt-precorrin-5B (C1)-methyltransferase
MILVFGGTTEGRMAAQTLDAAGTPFYYSTKGELQQVEMYNGERLCGAMDTVQLVHFCKENEIRLIIDAAHPFAQGVHGTIYSASRELGIKVVRYERNFGDVHPGVIWCKDYREAEEKLAADGITSLLALTGVNTIPKLKGYWSKEGNLCHFRVLDRDESRELAEKAGFPSCKLLFFNEKLLNAQGKGKEVMLLEKDFIERISPQAIITKESGESGYFNEKVEAALGCGVKVYAVRRPALPEDFIKVYGPVGLRMEVERLVPEFFPLKIGLTTGSTATAAVRGALRQLLYGEDLSEVYIVLPEGERVRMPLVGSGRDGDSAWGCAVKYSGDDPDVTNGHRIISTVRLNDLGVVRFFGGEGVGTVTLPGLGLDVGGPAINNGPRGMMRRIVEEELPDGRGVDITISVEGGRELAARTFNPRVGVVDGISIIGTSGVVRPFSKDAFLNSISREMDVAKALGVKHLVINSGARSEKKLKEKIKEQLPP